MLAREGWSRSCNADDGGSETPGGSAASLFCTQVNTPTTAMPIPLHCQWRKIIHELSADSTEYESARQALLHLERPRLSRPRTES
jgi:hypothetical protein